MDIYTYIYGHKLDNVLRTFNAREFRHKHVGDVPEFGTKFINYTQVVIISSLLLDLIKLIYKSNAHFMSLQAIRQETKYG